MLERWIARHAAPTLAGLKTANLVAVPYTSYAQLQCQLLAWHQTLCVKGVAVWLLGVQSGRALVYVCRPHRLAQDLSAEDSRRILRNCGYLDDGVQNCLLRLKRRLADSSSFPHEIGLFLGYPPRDVQGFLLHTGHHCKCSGLWRVYGDEQTALMLFAKYKKCTEVYARCHARGTPLWQLTVAV